MSWHRVALICPSQGIDTTAGNPASQLQLNILMAIAEFERGIIRERVTAGLRAAKARGTKLGRPGTLAKYGDAVRALIKSKLSLRQVSRRLVLPVSSIHKIKRQLEQSGNLI